RAPSRRAHRPQVDPRTPLRAAPDSDARRALTCTAICRTFLVGRCRMTASKIRKSDRLEVRVSPAHKALIEEAAALAGVPVAAFAVSTLIERAKGILRRHETTILAARDRHIVLESLDDAKP